MSICWYASSQDAEGQTLASLSVSGHAIIKPTSITTNGALSHGPLSYNWVMKTYYRTLSHYFYSWIQRTTLFGSLVFFKLISGISLACRILWICAGQCFHAYIMCERESLREKGDEGGSSSRRDLGVSCEASRWCHYRRLWVCFLYAWHRSFLHTLTDS